MKPAPRRKVGRPPKPHEDRQIRQGRNYNLWIAEELSVVFEALCERERRTKTAQLELILAEWFTSKGLLPNEGEEGGGR
jgi:hypothetical protein